MKMFNAFPALSKLSGALLLLGLTSASWTTSAHALSGSYAVLLKNPIGSENLVEIINNKGIYGVFSPGFGTEVTGVIQTARRMEVRDIEGDFGPALASMAEILAAGLPPLDHSYVALIESERGKLGSLRAEIPGTAVVLAQPSEAVLTNGYSNLPFQLDGQKLNADFGDALASMDAILKAGFRAQSYVVLMESPDGSVGKITVGDERGEAKVERAGNAVNMDPYTSEITPFMAEKDQINEDFGDTLSARPPLPSKYLLFFNYGGTTLTAESAQQAEKMLEELTQRPGPEIDIDGHTDAVGKPEFNDKLSLERAKAIADMISAKGIQPIALEVESYGKRVPLVATADNQPEPQNRRVEVRIR